MNMSHYLQQKKSIGYAHQSENYLIFTLPTSGTYTIITATTIKQNVSHLVVDFMLT